MSWTRPARSALLLASAAALLTACASGQTGPRGAGPQVANAPTPLQQYDITVSQSPEELALAPHAAGLSPAQRTALAAYAQGWRESGSEVITIASPSSGSGCGCDPRAAAQATAAALTSLGVPPALLRLASYDAGGQPGAPVIARYARYHASAPDCDAHWGNLVSTYDNRTASHFGCAAVANYAAMVANPRDLERPAPMDPADGVRRSVVLDKYRQGQVTSSSKDDQASGTVSSAVN